MGTNIKAARIPIMSINALLLTPRMVKFNILKATIA
jgi:hypothetical protein